MSAALPSHAEFLATVGDDFEATIESGPSFTLTMSACSEELRSGGYSSYTLSFHSSDSSVQPQSIFDLRHPLLGALQIFLVPTLQDADGVEYTAHFNSLEA